MLTKEEKQRQAVELLCTDMLVPKDHLLRKIDKAVDFDRIYDIVSRYKREVKTASSADDL